MNQVDRLAERTRKIMDAVNRNKLMEEGDRDLVSHHLRKAAEQLERVANEIPPKLNK